MSIHRVGQEDIFLRIGSETKHFTITSSIFGISPLLSTRFILQISHPTRPRHPTLWNLPVRQVRRRNCCTCNLQSPAILHPQTLPQLTKHSRSCEVPMDRKMNRKLQKNVRQNNLNTMGDCQKVSFKVGALLTSLKESVLARAGPNTTTKQWFGFLTNPHGK